MARLFRSIINLKEGPGRVGPGSPREDAVPSDFDLISSDGAGQRLSLRYLGLNLSGLSLGGLQGAVEGVYEFDSGAWRECDPCGNVNTRAGQVRRVGNVLTALA
jgi:hypothetical protein